MFIFGREQHRAPMDALPSIALLLVTECLAEALGRRALRTAEVARLGQASTTQRDVVALASGLTEVDPEVFRVRPQS